ncbi:MAG: hypothetical protein U9R15_07715 [Chloroflexota bacterium]|nr:hypothetical protein [Chloroflexota bacterium]
MTPWAINTPTRRIHVGPGERLHTAAQRVALLTVPAPDTSALELQSLHDQVFDVEEVARQFYRDYVRVFGALCDDIVQRNPKRKGEAEREAILQATQAEFFGPVRVAVMLDANGCNTTAAAIVAKILSAGEAAGKRAVVLAGTVPVGLRTAALLAQE